MLSKASIKRPVTTIMVMIIVVMTGIIALSGLKLDLMPTIDIPIAAVMTTYVGASPEDIETLITKPIEESLGTVANVDTISSVSSANSSTVIIQLEDGTDLDMASIDIREKIDMVKGSLPEDANEPIVFKMDVSMMSAIVVGITSDNMGLSELNTFLDDNVVNRFERIEGVASADLYGGVENEIEIIVEPDKMEGYGITTSQISQILKAENSNYPSGNIWQGNNKLQIRSLGEFKSIEEIKKLPITTGTGGIVHIDDIATVKEVQKDRDSYSYINGRQSIMISIQKQSTANVVDISDKVNAEISKVQKQYPTLHITMLTNTADYIKTSINNVVQTAFQAAILAVVILLLFLKDGKTSLIIGVSIPTSILATFALMYVSGMTMNMISMGGVTIGIGMLVDNSVVVLENIFKKWQNGLKAKEASEEGANEVAMAVMASTLTTVAVFIPLMFVTGTIGQMFRDLSLTITFSLAASLVVSLTFVPMACSKVLASQENRKSKRETIFTKFLNAWGRGLEAIDRGYRAVLAFCLRNKKKTVLLVIVAFIATLSLVPVIGVDFMPTMDEGSAAVNISLPKGSVVEETQKITNEVVSRIDDIPETKDMYVSIGSSGMMSGGSDSASVQLNFIGKDERDRSTDEIVEDIRQRIKGIAGADITVSSSSSAMGSMGGASISMQINGDDLDELRDIGDDLVKIISQIEGTRDISNSAEETVPEVNIVINHSKASTYGITTGTIASAVNTAVSGSVATTYKVNGTELDVRIRQNKDETKYINDIKNISINAPTGTVVQLSDVADVQLKDSAQSINRKNQHRYITVDAAVVGRDMNSVKKDIDDKLTKYVFPDGYTYEYTGILETMGESYSNLGLVLIVAVALVYMIMASQFESLIHPFIVMFSIPLAITGGIFGLFVTGNTLSVTAMMGFIMLVGMVVNNAIVLIDYTNQLLAKDENLTCNEALLEAGPNRLRPILMTTLTTVIGLLPMALATAEGTEMQRPLAISVIFGLSISTIVTLVFIPVLYSIIDVIRFRSIKKKLKKNKDKKIKINAN